MARYNSFKYGTGQTYGEVAASKYSVAPFLATAQDYNRVLLTWNPQVSTSGSITISQFRILRNQFAYSETETDGIYVLDSTSQSGIVYDTLNLSSGRFAFYTFWLKLSDNSWVLAGTAETLVPSSHTTKIYPRYINQDNVSISSNIFLQTTHERMLSYLPRIFLTGDSSTNNADESSSLSLFLEGFSFTIDEFLTYSQLVLPGLSGKYSNSAIVNLQTEQLGMPLDTQGLTKTQKYLVRDAIYIYSRKGTSAGLSRFIKAITGYVPVITVSSNLMLSLQNSSFYNGVGGWKTTSGITFSALKSGSVPTYGTSDLVAEKSWVGKIDALSNSGSIYLGQENPVTTGIPVVAGTEYSLTYWVKRDPASGSIFGQSITWYDQNGKKIPETVSQVGQTVTTSWVRKTYTRTAPAGAVFAGISLYFNSGTTYYIDSVQFAVSSETTFSDARAIKVYLTPNDGWATTRFTKVPRLLNEIQRYLPINTAYFITSTAGLEGFGISS